MKVFILLSVILAVLASLAAGTPISAAPHDILDSGEPVESDILSEIEYSTVLDTKLTHGFANIANAAGRIEREAGSTFAVPVGSTYVTSNTLLGVVGLVALVAFVAMFAMRTITSRLSVNRRGCYSQLVNSRRVTSPPSLHRPNRTSQLGGLSSSASWHNFDRVPSV